MNKYHILAILLILATFCMAPGIAMTISFSQGNNQSTSLVYLVGFVGLGGSIVLLILGQNKKKDDAKKEREFTPIPNHLMRPWSDSSHQNSPVPTRSIQKSKTYEEQQVDLHKGQGGERIYILLRDTAAGNEKAIKALVTLVNEHLLGLEQFELQVASALAKAFFSENATKQTRKLIWHIKDVVVVDYIHEYEIPLGYTDEDGNDTSTNRTHEKYTFWEYLDHFHTRDIERLGQTREFGR